jgi:preprotein translocase subunit YajC
LLDGRSYLALVIIFSYLYGTVTAINAEDDTVLLSIAPGVEVKFAFAALRDAASLPGQYRAGTSSYPEHESEQAPSATQTEPDEARPDRPAPERPDA